MLQLNCAEQIRFGCQQVCLMTGCMWTLDLPIQPRTVAAGLGAPLNKRGLETLVLRSLRCFLFFESGAIEQSDLKFGLE